MPIKCSNKSCGHINADGTSYCVKCGQLLGGMYEKIVVIKSEYDSMIGKFKEVDRKREEEQNSQYYVVLVSPGQAKLMLIKRLKEELHLGLEEAKSLVDSAPSIVKRNMTKNGANVGDTLDDLKAVHFGLFTRMQRYFDMSDEAKMYYKAEVLVKNFIPLKYITNISNFGIPIPAQPKTLQAKIPYTAQITRNTPTAFIFLVDHSVSMKKLTTLYGEEMTMAEAAARIVNSQINELVLRCVKMGDTRHYYDIAVVGYGEKAYSGWQGELEGRNFVSPEELKNHPYTKIATRKEVRTRNGVQVKEVEQVQWVSAKHNGSWTHYHEAFDYAKNLLDEWMKEHHEKDCYPPTIIHITDGEFNHATREEVMQKANELKAMFTNDGNVILFNIHFTADLDANSVACPISKDELDSNTYAEALFDMSSLLPERYNQDIARCLNDTRPGRHVAMGVNADATTLIKLMDIGTPTNISQNQ